MNSYTPKSKKKLKNPSTSFELTNKKKNTLVCSKSTEIENCSLKDIPINIHIAGEKNVEKVLLGLVLKEKKKLVVIAL